MNKCLIVYYSLNHSTEKIAEKIGEGLRQAGLETTLCNIKDEPCPNPLEFDLIGIGSPVYYFQIPLNVMDCIDSFPDLKGLKTFAFLTHGSYALDAGDILKRKLLTRNAKIQGWYYSYGEDYFLPYNELGCLPSYEHPSPDELNDAQKFGLDMGSESKDTLWPEVSEHAPFMYRMERFLAGRWFVRNIYQKLFSLDKEKCIKCGICIKDCPVQNIETGKDGYPKWNKHCNMCLACEMNCPKEAISSLINGPIMKPFVKYNVKQIMKDPTLRKVNVIHHNGQIKRL